MFAISVQFSTFSLHSIFNYHSTPTTRVCAIYRTPLGFYENLIRSDLFIYSNRRSDRKFSLFYFKSSKIFVSEIKPDIRTMYDVMSIFYQ